MQDNCGSVASFLRSAASSSGLPRDLDDVTIPDFSDVSGFVHAGGRGCGVSSLPARLLFLFVFGLLPFRTPVPTGRPDFTLCLCQRLICVWTVETTGFSCDEALCLKCILTHHLFFCVLVILISEGGFVPLTLIICMLFHI